MFIAGGGDEASITAPGHRADFGGVARECQQFVPVAKIPDLDRSIGGGGRQFQSVGAVGHGVDLPAMAKTQVADDARDVVRHAHGLVRQLPARLPNRLVGLCEPTGGEGGVGFLGELVGLVHENRDEPLGDAILDNRVALSAEFRLHGLDLVQGRQLGGLRAQGADASPQHQCD